ncbi:hypothetical protein GK091_00890 [Spirosoma agri]|uniref:Uncharacterized protein n=1 Tax=Spirosoma agri TaxID=1987381 RepID=A0A6M0ICD4_9BACT|nr:hypothetical protein [Spirosoma agri]NEU65425.1 hypothetical protein [Spirosoma agri]
MNKNLLFCALLFSMTACQQNDEIQPNSSSLAGEVVGSYQTNLYIDPSYAATPTDKMPSAELKAESDSTVTLIYTRLYPAREVKQLAHVGLIRQAEAVQLRIADSSIGSFQTDRVFTNNGMEKQGKVLRIALQQGEQDLIYFTGHRK